MKVLVTGGVRSGKSAHAEGLLGDAPAVYVAPGPTTDEDTDPDWADRIARHRARRPTRWRTVETRDLAGAVDDAQRDGRPVIVDCLGTWLTAVLDDAGWDAPRDSLEDAVAGPLGALCDAVTRAEVDVVLVTNEVGAGVVPEHRSGRVFRDLLGTVNQRVATACDDVVLVVAGRTLTL